MMFGTFYTDAVAPFNESNIDNLNWSSAAYYADLQHGAELH